MKKRIKLQANYDNTFNAGHYSCVPVKELSYFNDLDDCRAVVNPRFKNNPSIDRLYIKILSTDPLTSQIFNFQMKFAVQVAITVWSVIKLMKPEILISFCR